MKYEQFLEVYNTGPKATYELFLSILKVNALLLERTEQLEKRVQELEAQLNINNRNSSKPPSVDEFIKPKSQRKKSGKPSGGQKGPKALQMSAPPDHRIIHTIKDCFGCSHALEAVPADNIEKRQVFDLPALQVEVTEHLAQSKSIPVAERRTKPFP
jgi:transposase